jgi:predicted RNase H-like HicB family nuclease
VLSTTSFEFTIDLQDVPYEYAYDLDSGDVTAFNDDLRVMAVGSSVAEAEENFRVALRHWLLAELLGGRALPERIREAVVEPDRAGGTRRSSLVPA